MPHVDPGQKILFYEHVEELSQIQDRRKVLVGGCFDILHFGHFTFLHKAAHQGDVLIVALESDEFMETHKKKKPVHTQEERAQILGGLGFVDCVIMLPYLKTDEDYKKLVTAVSPQIIAVTEDDKNLKKKERHAKEVGASVAIVTPRLTEFSSSSISSA